MWPLSVTYLEFKAHLTSLSSIHIWCHKSRNGLIGRYYLPSQAELFHRDTNIKKTNQIKHFPCIQAQLLGMQFPVNVQPLVGWWKGKPHRGRGCDTEKQTRWFIQATWKDPMNLLGVHAAKMICDNTLSASDINNDTNVTTAHECFLTARKQISGVREWSKNFRGVKTSWEDGGGSAKCNLLIIISYIQHLNTY